jgi:hypothetical protein
MAFSEDERRKYARVEVNISVEYHVLGVIENLNFGKTRDSSVGGFCLETREKISRGVCLVLEIPWPSRLTPVRLLGRVINSVPSGIIDSDFDTRIEFLAFDEEHKKLVNQIVDFYKNKR